MYQDRGFVSKTVKEQSQKYCYGSLRAGQGGDMSRGLVHHEC